MKALLDANVLYPATLPNLRSLLIDLSLQGLYQAHWTDRMHDEWTRNLLLNRPDLDPEKLQRTRELMDRAIDTAKISGYEPLIPQFRLPDPDDCHVVAAALHGGAELIVTRNLRDFPAEVLEPLGLQAIHPDQLVQTFLARDPALVLEALERQGLPMTVAAPQEHLDRFSTPCSAAPCLEESGTRPKKRPHGR